MRTVDEREVRAPLERIYALASDIEAWPTYLAHYRFVQFWERGSDGGGIVEMSANRSFFGLVHWPTWWVSRMSIARAADGRPIIRYTHIEGITKGMDVAWTFHPIDDGMTHVRIRHEWTGPRWPVIGRSVADHVIGPIFIHGIASRTLEGLATVAERNDQRSTS